VLYDGLGRNLDVMPKYKISFFGPAVHVVIWVVLLAIPAVIFHNVPGNPGLPGAFFLFTNIYHIGLFYGNALLLYPGLMTRRRWPLYFLSLAAVLAISYYGKLFAEVLFKRLKRTKNDHTNGYIQRNTLTAAC